MLIRHATDADIDQVVALVHLAYRVPGAPGWTTEAGLLTGARISAADLRVQLSSDPAAHLLVAVEGERPVGCVLLHAQADGAWHFGLLSVRPDRQDRRLGRALLAHAEAMASASGAHAMRMSVISLRGSLIDWYVRRGYAATGETRAFPHGECVGCPRRDDLVLAVFEKPLAPMIDQPLSLRTSMKALNPGGM